MAGVIFSARNAGYTYPTAQRRAVHDVSLDVSRGELVGIVGPNGSGKTTLLRLFLGMIEPATGAVETAGRTASRWPRRELAQLVGAVPQREEPAFPLRVRQAVLFGRYPHLRGFGRLTGHDHDAVAHAMQQCDIEHLAERWVATLSGGEWQRVRIARALAQEPEALLLDEPTANLDVRHEMEVFELIASLVRAHGLAVIVVTHQVNLVARFADRLILMDEGTIRAVGEPRNVLLAETFESVFDWPVEIRHWQGAPQVVPLRRRETGNVKRET